MSQKSSVTSLSILITALFLLIGFSCKNRGERPDTAKTQVKTGEKSASGPSVEIMERGKKIYDEQCLACHQENGSGIPEMYPPVTKSAYVIGDKERLVKLILEGREVPVAINGQQYDNIMPPFDNLNDNEISDMLTYLRNTFGNSADAVSVDEVSAIRKKTPQ
jgi:mono/diheme cytochrome c family protein